MWWKTQTNNKKRTDNVAYQSGIWRGGRRCLCAKYAKQESLTIRHFRQKKTELKTCIIVVDKPRYIHLLGVRLILVGQHAPVLTLHDIRWNKVVNWRVTWYMWYSFAVEHTHAGSYGAQRLVSTSNAWRGNLHLLPAAPARRRHYEQIRTCWLSERSTSALQEMAGRPWTATVTPQYNERARKPRTRGGAPLYPGFTVSHIIVSPTHTHGDLTSLIVWLYYFAYAYSKCTVQRST